MAADEVLLEHCQQPTLRLYAWEKPCLSLGYAQRWRGGLPEGVDQVRRPSGGRAVLHDQEITYAMALPEFSGSLQEVYSHLTGLWLSTLAALIPGVTRAQSRHRGVSGASCYELTQSGEILLHGRKLMGSAQVRRGRRLLQHGSLPLKVDRELFQRVLPGAEPPATLGEMTAEALMKAFPESWTRDSWTDEEISLISRKAACLREEIRTL